MRRNKIVLGLTLVLGAVLLTTGCKAKLANGEEVAISVNGQNITADDLYKELKKKYAKSLIVDEIDKKIFNEIYKDDAEIEENVNKQIEYYKSMYSDNWDKMLKQSGFTDDNDLKDYFRLSFQREKAANDYIKENISDNDIKKYYDEELGNDVSAKHILIKVSDDVTDEEAKAKAEDLINQLNNGADFSTLASENSDDTGSKSNGGSLGYFNKGDMVKEFEDAVYSLEVGKYTTEPVKTSYGYHIILKTDEKEKGSLEDLKETIKEKIYNKKLNDDTNAQSNALIEIRKNYKLDFNDSKLKDLYNEYIDDLNSKEE